ncbi:MAG: heavy metal translocating P-type ATPase metal-binding domain-containing protein [Bacteroidota bacterium]
MLAPVLQSKISEKVTCFHCGLECENKEISIAEKYFCCNGCKTVYEILEANNLCNYYSIDEKPGKTQKQNIKRNFDFLDDEDVKAKLIDFTNGKRTTVTFQIPQMHCSSCIWILENLYKFNSGITNSQVNFLKKTLSLNYTEELTSLKEVVEQLDSIGYLPQLNLESGLSNHQNETNKKLYYKIGIAGFCFGNIMLLSFPEYLSFVDSNTGNLKQIFAFVNIVLSLPVFFYSASEYFISAIKGLRKKLVNIDVPISVGIIALFGRSLFEIISGTGAGYLDSLAALIFFLLTGKLFQSKTYEALNFERNYTSYFPIAVTHKRLDKETTIPIEKLKVGMKIIVKSNELIPADSVLISSEANIDYGFVTGESETVRKINGDIIYSGGKQVGGEIELEVIKEISQSYLTQLWNNKAFKKDFDSPLNSIVNVVSKYFTAAIFVIASSAFLFWAFTNAGLAINAFTAVLIIACPCALALSTPFTLGNTLRIFGKNKFYIKNVEVIEKLAAINNIVFDKTGTITESGKSQIEYSGNELSDIDNKLISSLVKNSSHPFSRALLQFLNSEETEKCEDFIEIPGEGLQAVIDNKKIKIGSRNFVSVGNNSFPNKSGSTVFYSIEGKIKGYFRVTNLYRNGLKDIGAALSKNYSVSVVTGDNRGEEANLKKYFPEGTDFLFNQLPQEKLEYILSLQNQNKKVLMIGDGLNDAGALKQSEVGISISEDVNNFSPACDGILESNSFIKLKDFISFSKTSKKIIIISFIISFLYNLAGLSFAVQGTLSPVIAAILMPVSSISVVLFATLSTNLIAKKRGLI